MSIRPLPQDAVDKIKSASAISSLNQVACGLLKNSLDARSSKVNLHLDYLLGNCVVEDNGDGIEPFEFLEDGGLLKLHHTSKASFRSVEAHGRHGSFLTNVAAFSLIAVTSCTRRGLAHATMSAHDGEVLTRGVPAPSDLRLGSFQHGTRVSVRSLFGSMPVRVKHRGTAFSDHSRLEKEWNALVRDVAALLLAWPSEMSVSLTEISAKREVRLRSACLGLSVRASRLFTQAGLSESEDADSWTQVSASSRRVRIRGAISTIPVATRRSQIMSLGISPIPNDYGTNVLFEEVNNIFHSSNFGMEDAGQDTERVRGKCRKNLERRPMFYLEIHFAGADESSALDDSLGQSQHRLESIIDLLRVVCHGFLKKHGMQSRRFSNVKSLTGSRTRQPPGTSNGFLSTDRRALTYDNGISCPKNSFHMWDRIKMGKPIPENTQSKIGQDNELRQSVEPFPRRLVGRGGILLRKPFDDVEGIGLPSSPSPQIKGLCEAAHDVQDREPAHGSDGKPCTTDRPGAHHLDQPQILGDSDKQMPSRAQGWLQDTVATWRNPIFETAEIPVPALSRVGDLPQRPAEVKRGASSSRFYANQHEVDFETVALGLESQLSRVALAGAEFIGQVDKKFVLLQLPLKYANTKAKPGSSSALVMLDQHAADERCRLEELMSLYFEADKAPLCAVTELIDEPIVLDVSLTEGQLIKRLRSHFSTWGVQYTVSSISQLRSVSVEVSHLPPSILERCRSDPTLVMGILCREIWRLEDGNIPPRPAHDPGRSWASCFTNCPQGILELLHSRSCRSAVMFNDELTEEECKQLVRRLSRCAFPFQCAHGRPSMVPLVDIGPGSGRLGRWKVNKPILSQSAWKHWVEQS